MAEVIKVVALYLAVGEVEAVRVDKTFEEVVDRLLPLKVFVRRPDRVSELGPEQSHGPGA